MTETRPRIAVIGGGIAGMGAAWAIHQFQDVVLYEAAPRLGGHAHTVTLDLDDGPCPVDVGFIVYNTHNYPHLVRLFEALGVETYASDMSFAVSAEGGAYEYAGSLPGLLAQPANLLKSDYWRMLTDLLRFYRTAPAAIAGRGGAPLSLGEFLQQEGYSQPFIRLHLLPMAAAIWSSPPEDVLTYPARRFISFFENHRLLNLGERPVWRSVLGGSENYVSKIAEDLGPTALRLGHPVVSVRREPTGLVVRDRMGQEDSFDQVVFACHGDQALAIMGAEATARQRQVMSAFTYQPNQAYLHRDPRLMPRRRRVWSSWNYMAPQGGMAEEMPCCVSYWMNALQQLPTNHDLFVTLNPPHAPDPALTHGEFQFDHPQFNQAAITAQEDLKDIQGENGLWFCGSYCGYGFHEDGLQAGLSVAAALGCPAPWWYRVTPMSPAAQCVAPDTRLGVEPARSLEAAE